MKGLILAFLLMTLPLHSEAADYPAEVQAIVEESPVSFSEFLSMDIRQILGGIVKPFWEGFQAPARLAVRAAAYLLLAALVMVLLSGSGFRQVIETVITFGFAALYAEPLTGLHQQISDLSRDWHTYLCGFVPVFSGVLAVQGQPTAAAVYDGLFIGISSLAVQFIGALFLPVVQGYLCVAAAAQLWGNSGAADTAGLLYKCSSWMLKTLTGLMAAILCLQGSFAGLTDKAAGAGVTAAAKLALPIVGDLAVQAAGSVLAGFRLMKGALAFCAVLYVGASFLPIFGSCVSLMLLFWGSAVGAKSLGFSRCGAMAEHFGNAVQLCASVLTFYFFLVVFSTMLMVLLGGGS